MSPERLVSVGIQDRGERRWQVMRVRHKTTGEVGVVVGEDDDGVFVEPVPGTTDWLVNYPVHPVFWDRRLVTVVSPGG